MSPRIGPISLVSARLEHIISGWYNVKDYASIQACLDAVGSGAVIVVPVGTYAETITIAGNDIILMGSGWNTKIAGGTLGHAINITGNSVTIQNIEASTLANQGNAYDAFQLEGNYCRLINCKASQTDRYCVDVRTASNAVISGCVLTGSDQAGIALIAGKSIVIGNHIYNITNDHGIFMWDGGDNSIITANYIDTTGDDGIYIRPLAENCVVVGNRITNWTNEAIDDDSGTSTVGNNDLT